MYETDRRLDWEEFPAGTCYHDPEEIDYVAATQSSSAPPGVVRALAVGSSDAPPGEDQAVAVDLSETDFLPAQQCCPHAAHARSLIPDVLRTAMMCGRRKPRELLSQWFKTPVRFLPDVFSN